MRATLCVFYLAHPHYLEVWRHRRVHRRVYQWRAARVVELSQL
jgi:hypothetical protein